jgi:glycine cleavage system transcriptional repressor
MDNYLVISALGRDRPGIVDALTKAILDNGCNIIDSRMMVLGGEFSILLMLSGPWNAIAKMEDVVEALEKHLDLTIIARRTALREPQSGCLPYTVEVVSIDHPGIVNQVAHFFSSRNINIEDLYTSTYPAAHTGTPMFSLTMTAGVPGHIHIASLREEFMHFCDDLNLDGVIEPVKGP